MFLEDWQLLGKLMVAAFGLVFQLHLVKPGEDIHRHEKTNPARRIQRVLEAYRTEEENTNKKRKIHGSLSVCWKICCLGVNGQSFLVIDGYLLNSLSFSLFLKSIIFL